ncbi:protein kinase [Mycobacterium saskatchewanense]|uniref:non-specific serine/threonine protein kinase n=1 Tax=Mycobacterium saskatchewanense TaxID=220927 RepID=A0AAJ3NK77_9MYCO|nr:serine/threonine-protein kinase [Mycobacterium saskatchewanense]ORW64197.1 protein kinase [Mycobacterium saskatchewanense]BBX62096.1 protein kinase [Mycobacterium saskatchewanense]
MSSPQPGSRLASPFGPYELRSLIGVGATGEVHRAVDTRHDRVVALKVLRPELAADPRFRDRFRREVHVTARLREPHVLPVYDFGDIDGVPFVAMHPVDGGSLAELLRARGPLEPKWAAAMVGQVAAALDSAHAAGLVHGDVRPQNVLLASDDFAYLADFGIGAGPGAHTAPERFSGGRVGPEADVYSLTSVFYECLTGATPFVCDDLAELKDAHLYVPPPRPSIMRRGIDREFDGVIARGMAKPPGARYSSAGELAEAANAAAWSVPPPARSPTTRPFTAMYPNPDDTGYSPYPVIAAETAAAPSTLGRGPRVAAGAAAALLAVAAVIAAVVMVVGNRHGPPPGTVSASPPSTAPASATPTLSRPVSGADGLGFVGHTARCDPGNPPAAVLRTSLSLVVVCSTGPSSFYYRGERIRDGAHIQLADVVRTSGGFDATNPSGGVHYEVRPERLRIISNGHVDSSEAALEYASAA